MKYITHIKEMKQKQAEMVTDISNYWEDTTYTKKLELLLKTNNSNHRYIYDYALFSNNIINTRQLNWDEVTIKFNDGTLKKVNGMPYGVYENRRTKTRPISNAANDNRRE